MRLRLMVAGSTLILSACVPRAGEHDHVNSAVAVPVITGPQIVAEQVLVAETPSWSPANVGRNARQIPTSTYIVKHGDSLLAIAATTGAGATAIADTNNLTAPYALRPGRRLEISGGRYHRVGIGETGIGRLDVKKGEKVSAGQHIGGVGETGYVRQPQLHFQVRKNRQAVNPLSYLEPVNG